jgi:5-methylcytosine-specific restriction endonuclease McrA
MTDYIIRIGAVSFHSRDLENKWKWAVRVEFFDCVRQTIFDGRERASCCHCTRLITIDKATIEHIVPRSRGGERFLPSNLTIACAKCNRRRGTQDFNEFRAMRIEQIKKYGCPGYQESDFLDRIETTNDYEILAA